MACTGSPGGCTYRNEGDCLTCGCDWDSELRFCFGTPDPCSSHGNQENCDLCKCDWPVGTNIKINIGDVWHDASEMKINVGDVWRNVTEIWINIGDLWKRVF